MVDRDERDPPTPADEAYRLYAEARSCLKRGDPAEGTRLLKESVRLAPHYKTFELLGERLIDANAPAEAVLYLAAACGLGNRTFRAHYLLARALLKLGPEWTDDATTQLRRALQHKPDYKAASQLMDELTSRPR